MGTATARRQALQISPMLSRRGLTRALAAGRAGLPSSLLPDASNSISPLLVKATRPGVATVISRRKTSDSISKGRPARTEPPPPAGSLRMADSISADSHETAAALKRKEAAAVSKLHPIASSIPSASSSTASSANLSSASSSSSAPSEASPGSFSSSSSSSSSTSAASMKLESPISSTFSTSASSKVDEDLELAGPEGAALGVDDRTMVNEDQEDGKDGLQREFRPRLERKASLQANLQAGSAKEREADFKDIMVDRLVAWLDKTDDSGFRGSFVSGRKADDLDALVNHYTAPALARALRDREEVLAECASIVCASNDQISPEALQAARDLLSPYANMSLARSHYREANMDRWDPDNPEREFSMGEELAVPNDAHDYVLPDFREGGLFHPEVLNRLRKRLNRLPREISSRARKRASVIVPLCHVRNVPSILFTQRSHNINRHKGEVCFPGGMIDDTDKSVVDTGLRELHEEVGIPRGAVNVLGILRSDWSELAAITGVAVTPVVGYLGAFEELKLDPNPDEVRDFFTVPVSALLDQDNWVVRDYSPPVFREKDAPKDRVIWGLTGYILHRFMKLLPSVVFDKDVVTREFSLGYCDH